MEIRDTYRKNSMYPASCLGRLGKARSQDEMLLANEAWGTPVVQKEPNFIKGVTSSPQSKTVDRVKRQETKRIPGTIYETAVRV